MNFLLYYIHLIMSLVYSTKDTNYNQNIQLDMVITTYYNTLLETTSVHFEILVLQIMNDLKPEECLNIL